MEQPLEEQVLVTVTWREPVTLRMLRAACALVKIDLDDFLRNPQTTMQEAHLPMSRAQPFCDLVLVEPPRLNVMPDDQAVALALWVCQDFFLAVLVRRLATQTVIWVNSLSGRAPLEEVLTA